jgi:hypothetical protein
MTDLGETLPTDVDALQAMILAERLDIVPAQFRVLVVRRERKSVV